MHQKAVSLSCRRGSAPKKPNSPKKSRKAPQQCAASTNNANGKRSEKKPLSGLESARETILQGLLRQHGVALGRVSVIPQAIASNNPTELAAITAARADGMADALISLIWGSQASELLSLHFTGAARLTFSSCQRDAAAVLSCLNCAVGSAVGSLTGISSLQT